MAWRPLPVDSQPGGKTNDGPSSIRRSRPARPRPRPGGPCPRTPLYRLLYHHRDRPPLPLWCLVLGGDLVFSSALAGVLWRGIRMGTGPPSAATSSPKMTASGSTGRPGPAATPGAGITRREGMRVKVFTITAPSPDRPRKRFRHRALSSRPAPSPRARAPRSVRCRRVSPPAIPR